MFSQQNCKPSTEQPVKIYDIVHSQKRYRLAASCQRIAASLLNSSIRLQQVCENQTCCNLIFADLPQLLKQPASSPWKNNLDNQLATNLLTTCSTMRTHPDIGLITAGQQAYTADLLQLSRFCLCNMWNPSMHTT